MAYDYDTLIAGAGPAGCAAAYDLARGGKRVLLLDKRTFPRPKTCACGLTRKTLKALRYSVDPVIERVCNEIVLEQATEPNSRRPRRTRVRTRKPICAMAVRERFDDFCLRQTLAAGRNGGSVELLKIETIADLRELSTHIELDIVTANGPHTLTAPVLIGADGSNGRTRRLAEALLNHPEALSSRPESWRPYREDAAERPAASFAAALPPSTLSTESVWYTNGFALEATVPYADLPATLPGGGAPNDLVFDFAPLPGGYGWLFPKGDHINIGVGAFAPSKETRGAPSSTRLESVTRQLLTDYAREKLGVSTLAHITGQQLGMGGHAYVPRGRVLLAGDAAGLVDPLTGEGIHSAIVSGQAAAAAILACGVKKSSGVRESSSNNESSSVKESSSNNESSSVNESSSEADFTHDIAAAYAANLRPLKETLAFSHRAARAFYADPARGFRAMRLPILRSLILNTYADGVPHTKLLTALAKLV